MSELTAADLELFHYGVKGMKWGVIRKEGPDGTVSSAAGKSAKPPSERKQARIEKRDVKARKIETRVAKMDVQLSELNSELTKLPTGFKTIYKRQNLKAQINESTDIRKQLQKDADAVRAGRLTRNQKLMLAGGIAAASVAGFMVYSSMEQSGQLNSIQLRGKAFLKGEKFEFNKSSAFANKNLSPDEVLNNVVKGLNPNYKNPGGSMNCRRVSYAYELRRRGYDVTATPSSMGWGQSESGVINALSPKGKKYYNSASVSSMVVDPLKDIRSLAGNDSRTNPASFMKKIVAEPISIEQLRKEGPGVPLSELLKLSSESRPPIRASKITDSLKDLPNGARGEILWDFKSFGHSMSWEIFDGKPVIFDTQKAQKYDVTDEGFKKLMDKWGVSSAAEITRLDNVDLDVNFLSRWATNTQR